MIRAHPPSVSPDVPMLSEPPRGIASTAFLMMLCERLLDLELVGQELREGGIALPRHRDPLFPDRIPAGRTSTWSTRLSRFTLVRARRRGFAAYRISEATWSTRPDCRLIRLVNF